jgi:hypothetical protein
MIERNAGPVRTGDPETSHMAAAVVGPSIRTVRARVLLLLAMPDADNGLTHDELIALYRRRGRLLGWPPASDSSIRTRCNELWKDGEVERVPETAGKSRAGNTSLLWRAADVQREKTAGDKPVDGVA